MNSKIIIVPQTFRAENFFSCFVVRGANSLCSTCGSGSSLFASRSSAIFVLRERATLIGSPGLYSTTSTSSRCICDKRGSISLLSVGSTSVFMSCSSNSSAYFSISSVRVRPTFSNPLMLAYKVSSLVITIMS